jgi:hypothetical protein
MNRTILIFILLPILLAAIFFRALRASSSRNRARTVTTDVVQGIFAGAGLAFITVMFVLPRFYVTNVNGWTTMSGCGDPANGLLLRAACNVTFKGPINVSQEAMYWTTSDDATGHTLSGAHGYRMHFAPGQTPPNKAFWSLTMSDAANRFVPNPVHRFSVNDRSGLLPNADRSIDIYIQSTPPPGHEANWLPAPAGNFILWLRVYLPCPTVLDGEYKMPPVVQVS